MLSFRFCSRLFPTPPLVQRLSALNGSGHDLLKSHADGRCHGPGQDIRNCLANIDRIFFDCVTLFQGVVQFKIQMRIAFNLKVNRHTQCITPPLFWHPPRCVAIANIGFDGVWGSAKKKQKANVCCDLSMVADYLM